MPARLSPLCAASRSSNARSWSSSNSNFGRVATRSRFGERLGEFECGARNCEPPLYHWVALRAVAHHAAIFERDPVGIFEINRPRPSVVDDFCRLDTLAAQFVALLHQRSRRPGLESKMVE